MINFTFLNYTFSYPDESRQSVALFGEWMEKAVEAEKIFDSLYDEQESEFFSFVIDLNNTANDILQSELEEIVGLLFRNGINSSEEEFIAKYEDEFDFNYEYHINSVVKQFNGILEYAESLDRNREENSKILSGRWEGGGFGLGGALKGALQAGLLNAVQDGINSISKSSQEKQDIQKVNARMYDLYSNPQTKKVMCSAISECYKNLYYALSKEMLENGIFSFPLQLDEIAAEKIFVNTMRFCKGDEIIKNLCKCVELYPAKKYLEQIYSVLPKEQDPLFQEFISFWNLNFYELNQAALEKRREEERLAIEEKKARDEEEARIKKEKKEAEELQAQALKKKKEKLIILRKNIAAKYAEIFNGMDEYSADKIILPNRHERMQKIISFYKPTFGEEPILAYDDTVMKSGKKGFLLTDSKIYFTDDKRNNEITVFGIYDIHDLMFKKSLLSPEIRFNGCSVCTIQLGSKYGIMLEQLLEQAIIMLKNDCTNSDLQDTNISEPNSNEIDTITQNLPEDKSSIGFAILGFLLPLIGLILFLAWRKKTPLKAKSCIKGAIFGIIIFMLLQSL